MVPIDVVLILLIALVVSAAVARALPIPVPLPLVQIATGVVLVAVTDLGIELDPDIFFLLFLPPLLFFDGWRTSRHGLWRDRWAILALALGLVIFTVAGVGLFIGWLIPSMPLAVAFALAAVISPTDPLAVSAIAARTGVPPRLMRILEGESLLNDASGLVCLRFAVAAALSGTFSPLGAAATFVWLAVGGLAIGVAVTWSAAWVREWMSRNYGEDTSSAIVISLLVPFGAYLLAEVTRCSGVLAVVAAGVTMSYVEQRGGAFAITRVRRSAVWETVAFAASGIVFILLGEQLPGIVSGAAHAVRETGHRESIWLLAYVVAISLALAVVRFIWVWTSLRYTLRGAKGETLPRFFPGWRLTAAMSVAGARGAVTLAGVLTLPLTTASGAPFPARDLAIFLAAGVICASLVSASLLLPRLFGGLRLPFEPGAQDAEDKARVAASTAALQALANAQHDLVSAGKDADIYTDAGARITSFYQQRIDAGSKAGSARDAAREADRIERNLWLVCCRAERAEIYRLVRRRAVNDEVARKMVREIDLLETRLNAT